jgi:hypothetical protein
MFSFLELQETLPLEDLLPYCLGNVSDFWEYFRVSLSSIYLVS